MNLINFVFLVLPVLIPWESDVDFKMVVYYDSYIYWYLGKYKKKTVAAANRKTKHV